MLNKRKEGKNSYSKSERKGEGDHASFFKNGFYDSHD